MDFFATFLEYFDTADTASTQAAIIFISAAALTAILRVIVFIGYQIQYQAFKLGAKDLKHKSEIPSVKNGIAVKIIKDYTRLCNKGVAHINTAAIVRKHLLGIRFVYWTFDSIGRFIKGVDRAIPPVGLILSLSLGFPGFFGYLTVALFVILLVLAATFDYEHIYAKLESEMTEYLEREIGQFYILDMNTGLTKLNKTMNESAASQAAVTGDAIKKLGETLSSALMLTVDEMRKNLEDTIKTINSYSDVLKKPLDEWRGAVEYATENQKQINAAVKSLNSAAAAFMKTTASAEQSFKNHIVMLENEKDFVNAQINALQDITRAASANGELSKANKAAIDNALSFIEKNQAVLGESLDRYELALEQITSKVGEALGSILNYHIENSYSSLNARLDENLDRILKSNAGLTDSLQSSFNEIAALLKGQLQVMFNLTETEKG